MIEKLKKSLSSERFSFKSVTAMILFGAIVMVFVFFGMPNRRSALGGGGAAAQVNDVLISVADLRSEASRLEQMYSQFFGGNKGGDAQRQFLRQQALENLINSELVSQAAKTQGILVTDAEVREYITQMQVFQREGKFQREAYLQILEANQLTPSEFEQKVRKDLKSQRSRRLFEMATTPLAFEVQKLKALRENKMNISFAKLDQDKLLKSIKVSDSDVTARLHDADFKKKVEDDFRANRASYDTEEQVHASHILIKAEAGNEVSEKSALEKIRSIKKRAEKEDFGRLASELSEDMGSKKNKGDLGFFGHGHMVPEFETAAFTQAAGVVGEPVKTPYGYHLIRVIEKKAKKEAKLEDLEKEIARKLIAKDKMDVTLKALEEALNKKDVAQVDAKLKELGVSWEETGFFDMSTDVIPKLGTPVASQAAFELSEAQPLLPRLVREANQKYVMKFKAAKREPLTAGVDLEGQQMRERSYELFSSWVEQERKSAKIERNLGLLSGRQ